MSKKNVFNKKNKQPWKPNQKNLNFFFSRKAKKNRLFNTSKTISATQMKGLPGINRVAAGTRGFYHCFCLAFPLPKHFIITYLFILHLCWNLIRKIAICLQWQVYLGHNSAFFHKKHCRGVREVNLHFPSTHLSRSIYLNCYWKINPWKKKGQFAHVSVVEGLFRASVMKFLSN